MAQFALPMLDIVINGWTAEGGPTDLYDAINESTADDSDYIETIGDDTAEVALTTPTDPEVATGHIIHFRIQGNGSGGPERCEAHLYEGANLRASSGTRTSRAAWSTETYTLSAAEANSITAYTDLRLRFVASNMGDPETMWVSWAQLEVPDAVASVDVDMTLAQVSVTAFNFEVEEGTTVDVTLAQVNVTPFNLEVEEGVTVDMALGVVNVTPFNFEIDLSLNVDMTLGQVSVTALNFEVEEGTTVDMTLGQVSVTPLAFEVEEGTTVEMGLGQVSVTPFAFEVEEGVAVDMALGQVSVTPLAFEIEEGTTVDMTLGQVSVTAYNYEIEEGTTVDMGLGQVSATPFGMTITTEDLVAADLCHLFTRMLGWKSRVLLPSYYVESTHANVAGPTRTHAHTAGTERRADHQHANVAGATHQQAKPQGGV